MDAGEEDMPEDFQSLNEEHFLGNSENHKESILGYEQDVGIISEPSAWPNRKNPRSSTVHSGMALVQMHKSDPVNNHTMITQSAKESGSMSASNAAL